MSVVLGINAYHAGASACLIVDGQPIAALAEERLNRVKYFAGFPTLAIRECLAMGGLSVREIDIVAVGRDSSTNRAQKVEYALRNPHKLLNLMKTRSARDALDDIGQLVADSFDVAREELTFTQHNIEHHLAHIASAYFASDFDHASGFSIDGSGDFVTCMFSECQGRNILIKQRIYVPHSLGSLYTMVCEFIGYGTYGDEGKVMGLAPLGQDTYADIFADMLSLTPSGIELNSKYFMPFGSSQGISIDEKGQMVVHRHYSDYMVELFGPPREPHSEITTRDQDLAFGLQAQFEKAYMHLLCLLHRRVPANQVVMAGGCALNSVANGKLFEETPFDRTWIQPAAGDEGLALGAALHVSNAILGEGERYVMRDAYLGPEFSEGAIRLALEAAGVSFARREREQLLQDTAAEIADGKVVGWFQGRMEWGPRALGNRSILAHPGYPGMKDILNSRIKHREEFRPFAPAVLAERQAEIFEHTHPSPFMLHVYKIRPEWRERLSAVNHVDNTGRLQTVARHENALYYDLIRAFETITGIPVVLNTSFNENEPIVCTPEEAINCYVRTRMDVMVIGPYICRKDG